MECGIAGWRKFADSSVWRVPASKRHGERVVPIFIGATVLQLRSQMHTGESRGALLQAAA